MGYQMLVFSRILACAFVTVYAIRVIQCSYQQEIVLYWDQKKWEVILVILMHKSVIGFIVFKCILVFVAFAADRFGKSHIYGKWCFCWGCTSTS